MKIKKRYSENAITLVALVISIIILLILAGVTLSSVLTENGLLQKTKIAVSDYEKSEEKEDENIKNLQNKLSEHLQDDQVIEEDYFDYIGAYVSGYTLQTKSCSISTTTSGHTSSQTFKTENMQWRLWDYDKKTKTVRLISDKPTSTNLYLVDALGYNNGVWALNEICRKCYSTEEPGVSALNLKRSDIQKVINYDYTNYSHNDSSSDDQNGSGKYKYGSTKKYSSYYKYPTLFGTSDINWQYSDRIDSNLQNDKDGLIWEEEKHDDGNISGTKSGSKDTEFKQSYWKKDYDITTSNFEDWKNIKYYDLLFKDGNGNTLKKSIGFLVVMFFSVITIVILDYNIYVLRVKIFL